VQGSKTAASTTSRASRAPGSSSRSRPVESESLEDGEELPLAGHTLEHV
jgi:hypothetical protein